YYDTAYMTVGKRAEYLVTFYSDTNAYNASTKLSGEVGDRLLVTIIATKAGTPTIDSISTGISTTISVSGTSGLVFYDSYTSTTSTTSFTMVNGRASVWVSSSDTINNGKIYVAASEYSSYNSPRDQIYFTRPAVSVDSAFYYSRTGFGMVDSVDIYYAVKLGMIPDSITLFWPGSDTGKRVISGTSAEMTLAADSSHITIVLANPFATEITVSTAPVSSKQGISYDRPNNNPGVQETSSPFAITDRVGPLVMTAQVLERIPAGTGTDTMYVSFSEDIKASSLVGNSLILIKNGVSTTISILAATATSTTSTSSFKLTVSTPTPVFGPVAGDSLRIEPAGPITDALGNSAHLLNRPVIITVKPIPAAINSGYYVDNDPSGKADGVVDSVVIKFNKSISIGDAIISLDWGSINKADSIAQTKINYVGTDSSLIEIYVRGLFKNIGADSVKTSGDMTATVVYKSIPNEFVQGSITDSAAAVAVDSAIYSPGKAVNGTSVDSLYVTFSEALGSIGQTSPFELLCTKLQVNYTLNLSNTGISSLVKTKSDGEKCTYKFIVDAVDTTTGVKYPANGDSLWINSTARVADNAAGKVQSAGNNRRVPLHVNPIPFDWNILIDKNPYIPSNDSMQIKIVITGTKMLEKVNLSAWGKIYDVLGNCIYEWKKGGHIFDKQGTELDLGWKGRNTQGRLVGSGVYSVDISIDNGTNVTNQRKRIGVKR
ncbi:MAG TPA: hypothetical protein DCO75_01030, partial [Fibrobacteres bacterium]|nr:hypothetical protein [Fibrobacterota bacterium]